MFSHLKKCMRVHVYFNYLSIYLFIYFYFFFFDDI